MLGGVIAEQKDADVQFIGSRCSDEAPVNAMGIDPQKIVEIATSQGKVTFTADDVWDVIGYLAAEDTALGRAWNDVILSDAPKVNLAPLKSEITTALGDSFPDHVRDQLSTGIAGYADSVREMRQTINGMR